VRERESQSGAVAKNRIWWPLQSPHCLLFLPPRLTLVFCLTLSFPFIYIFFFFFLFPFYLFIYLFISYISCAFVLLPLPSISLPSFQHLTYRTTGEEEKEEHIPFLPPSVLSRERQTYRQTSGKKDRAWVQG